MQAAGHDGECSAEWVALSDVSAPECCGAPMIRTTWSIYTDRPTLRCEACRKVAPDISYVPDETDEDSRWSLGARRSLIERGY